MRGFPKINMMGEQAILIQFEPKISEEILNEILSIKKLIQNNVLEQRVEVSNTYSSLLINYSSPIEDAYSELLAVERLIGEAKIQNNFEN